MIWQTRRGAANNPSGWLMALLERKAPKLAAVALANKMARIAGKLMASATQAPAGLSQPPDEIGARGHCLNALAPTLQETERWTGSFDRQREITARSNGRSRPLDCLDLPPAETILAGSLGCTNRPYTCTQANARPRNLHQPCKQGANGMDPALAAEWNLERQLR